MSKRRNRNRSAKQKTAPTPVDLTLEATIPAYTKRIRLALMKMGLPQILSEGMDQDSLRKERRILAAKHELDEFKDLLPEHNMSFSADTLQAFLNLVLGLASGPDSIDATSNITLAAAIWMLDKLADCGRYEDACRLFPTEPSAYENQYLPKVKDLTHEEQALRGMLWIMQHRNDDCAGLKSTNHELLPRTYMDVYTAAQMHQQDVPSRNRFMTILDMLPKDAVQDATDYYKISYDAAMTRMLQSFRIIYCWRDEIAAADREITRNVKCAMEELFPSFSGNITIPTEPRAMATNAQIQCTTQKAINIYNYRNGLKDDMQDLVLLTERLVSSIGLYHTLSEETQKAFFSEELCELWNDFKIHDPYKLAFAYLWLLDQGSDLPWIYGISSNLMAFCALSLPWSGMDTPEMQSEQEMTDLIEPIDPTTFTLYGTYLRDRKKDAEDYCVCRNLAQIICHQTSYIMPRKFEDYQSTSEWLERFGLTDCVLRAPIFNLFGILNAMNHHPQLPPPVIEENQHSDADPEELMRKIQALEAEKKALRQEAYESTRNAKVLQRKLESLENDTIADRQELAELRELVFRQDSEDTTVTSERVICYPFRTKRKILIIGGHESWYHAIRTNLPDARFWGRDAHPNAQSIRNADEIWLQTNSMSHALYRTILNIARPHGVPVHYFHYASAAKCAAQFVRSQSA